VKGKTTGIGDKNIMNIIASQIDDELKDQRTKQVLVCNVMHAESEKFLVTVSSPLELIIQAHLINQSADTIGRALQSQLGLIRSRGFCPIRVHVDPQGALRALQNLFPGVEIDVAGAGDHLSKIDIRIRRIKEVMRSIVSTLPWVLPATLIKDLVHYAVSRLNTRRTTALTDNVCPRVRFTARKVNYEKEFGLCFGDYVEVYNPRVISNRVKVQGII